MSYYKRGLSTRIEGGLLGEDESNGSWKPSGGLLGDSSENDGDFNPSGGLLGPVPEIEIETDRYWGTAFMPGPAGDVHLDHVTDTWEAEDEAQKWYSDLVLYEPEGRPGIKRVYYAAIWDMSEPGDGPLQEWRAPGFTMAQPRPPGWVREPGIVTAPTPVPEIEIEDAVIEEDGEGSGGSGVGMGLAAGGVGIMAALILGGKKKRKSAR